MDVSECQTSLEWNNEVATLDIQKLKKIKTCSSEHQEVQRSQTIKQFWYRGIRETFQ